MEIIFIFFFIAGRPLHWQYFSRPSLLKLKYSFSHYLLNIREIKNKINEVRIIKGPIGKFVILNNKKPETEHNIPKIRDRLEYWVKFLLKFLDAAAGIAINPAVKRIPTNFTSIAVTKATETK